MDKQTNKFTPPIRWGILGAGKNAGKFASDFPLAKQGRIEAIAARDLSRAQAFASQYNIPAAYGNYDQLLASDKIDIVYIGTVNSEHYPLTKQALLAGKPVLCEKPFTLHTEQTAELIQLARQRGLFLMEGIWTRCFPVIQTLSQQIRSGKHGQVLLAQMDFGFIGNPNPAGRLWNPALGGGALADVGIYPLTTAQLFLGKIVDFQAYTKLSPKGIDTRILIQAKHESGALSSLTAAIDALMPREATISTAQTMIRIPCPFWKPPFAIIHHHGGTTGSSPQETVETIGNQYPGKGFHFEIEHVCKCLLAGKTESPLMPLDETLQTVQLMDAIRTQCKIITP